MKLLEWEMVSYIIFGILTTLVDWIIYMVFLAVGMDYRWATVCAFIGAVLFAFVVNKLFVFRKKGMDHLIREFFTFISFRSLTGVFTLIMMIVLVDYLLIGELISKVFTSFLSLVLNYILSKWFIFKGDTHEA